MNDAASQVSPSAVAISKAAFPVSLGTRSLYVGT